MTAVDVGMLALEHFVHWMSDEDAGRSTRAQSADEQAHRDT